MEFDASLERMGFHPEDRPRRGSRAWSREANRFLTYWVHAYADDTALFTWEFAIADYLTTRGLLVGSSESLNTYMYPREDARGPQDAAWLAGALDAAEATLASIRFDQPEG